MKEMSTIIVIYLHFTSSKFACLVILYSMRLLMTKVESKNWAYGFHYWLSWKLILKNYRAINLFELLFMGNELDIFWLRVFDFMATKIVNSSGFVYDSEAVTKNWIFKCKVKRKNFKLFMKILPNLRRLQMFPMILSK